MICGQLNKLASLAFCHEDARVLAVIRDAPPPSAQSANSPAPDGEKLHWGPADQIWTNRDQSHKLKNGQLLERSVNIDMMNDHLVIKIRKQQGKGDDGKVKYCKRDESLTINHLKWLMMINL